MLSERNRRLVDEHLDAIAVYDEEQMNALLDAARSEADERVKGLVGVLREIDRMERDQTIPTPSALSGIANIVRSALKSMEASHPVSRSVPSSVGEGEWRPIESAPKDGTRVLVNFDGAGPIVAFRDPEQPSQWVRYLGYGKSHYWPSIDDGYALRWQPLPEPPSSQPSKILPGEGE